MLAHLRACAAGPETPCPHQVALFRRCRGRRLVANLALEARVKTLVHIEPCRRAADRGVLNVLLLGSCTAPVDTLGPAAMP